MRIPPTQLALDIQDQPLALKNLIEEESDHIADIAEQVKGDFDYVIVAARGSSDNAARYAQYLFCAHNRLPVALATPSMFTLYGTPPALTHGLVLGISQSGQSPDIVAVLEEAHRQGRPTITLTNDPSSPLALAADHVINLHAGPERAIAATKTYTTSLCALALFDAALRKDREQSDQIRRIPGLIHRTLKEFEPLIPRVERYRYMAHCVVIGRGYNYSTAFEIALKVKELTRIVAEPCSSADFRHGPIAMVGDGFPIFIIAPSGRVADDMAQLVQEIIKRRGEILAISDRAELLEQAQFALPIPSDIPEWLTPIVAVVPGQLFSLALALSKGYDPDQPFGLHKVTETL